MLFSVDCQNNFVVYINGERTANVYVLNNPELQIEGIMRII